MNIDRSNVSTDASYVMYAYMAVFVAIEFAFELQRICEKSFNSSKFNSKFDCTNDGYQHSYLTFKISR